VSDTVLVPERTSRRGGLTVLIYAICAGSLIWVFHDFQWDQFLANLNSIHWGWVALAVFFDVGSYVCQGARWNYVLRPLGAPSLYKSTQAIYVGLFTNEILPLRGGELVRAFLVSRWTKLPFSVVLGSVAIERLLDGIWLAAGLGVTALLVPLPPIVARGAQFFGLFIIAATVLLILVLAAGLRATHALEQTSAGQRGIFSSLLHFLDRLFEGLRQIGHSASLYWAFAATFVLLLTQILAVWAMMEAYGLDYSFWVSSAVLLILHLGTAIPNAPANLGSFQLFTVIGLTLFGVDKATAAEFSVVMFVILTVPLLAFGTIAVLQSGLSIQEIRSHVRRNFNSR
jgi:uncharacterized protein (TIRG00374 family)